MTTLKRYRGLIKYRAPYSNFEYCLAGSQEEAEDKIWALIESKGRGWMPKECVIILPADDYTLTEHQEFAKDRPYVRDIAVTSRDLGHADYLADDTDRVAAELMQALDDHANEIAYVNRCRAKRIEQLKQEPGGLEANGQRVEPEEFEPYQGSVTRLAKLLKREN